MPWLSAYGDLKQCVSEEDLCPPRGRCRQVQVKQELKQFRRSVHARFTKIPPKVSATRRQWVSKYVFHWRLRFKSFAKHVAPASKLTS